MKKIITIIIIVLLVWVGYEFYQNQTDNLITENELDTENGLNNQDDLDNDDNLDSNDDTADKDDQNDVFDDQPLLDGETAENAHLKVENPVPDQVVTSPLELSGEVRGSWLFEANAPVVLTNWDGLIISEGYIEAEGDWMTTEFIPFSGTLEFDEPEDIGEFSNKGQLIFNKANPSGLPEHDDALEYVVKFR